MHGIPCIKGLAFRGMMGSLRRLEGDDMVRRVVELLPAELAKTARAELFLTQTWYPIADYELVLRAMMSAKGADLDFIRTLSREAVLNDFRGIYRVLTFVMSPEFVMKRGPLLFGRYFDTGKLEVQASPGLAVAKYTGCKGFDLLLWQDTLAGSAAVLEACGAKNLETKFITGGRDRDDSCTVHFTWR
jgi:hypothetical protein